MIGGKKRNNGETGICVRKENNPRKSAGYSPFRYADSIEKHLFNIHPLNRQAGNE